MIPVFKLDAATATKHEEVIACLMWKMEAGKKKKPAFHRTYGNSNMGTTKQKRTWLQVERKRRATLVRAYLKKHPGAGTAEIAEGIGIEMRAMAAWCAKFRNSDEDYAIRFVKNMDTKKYKYWRSEDMPEEENGE